MLLSKKKKKKQNPINLKNNTKECIYKTNRFLDITNKLLITKGEKEVRRDKLGGAQWLSCKESVCNTGDKERQVQSMGREDPLEEDMATYSSILAGKIPWIEEPGGLQSIGSQRVRHD